MKYIKDQKNLNGMRVLLRLDLNVPLSNGIITDQTRIDKIIPIIKFLIEKNSKIIVISHVGRPNGKINKQLSLKPICQNLEKKINQKIKLVKQDIFELNKDNKFEKIKSKFDQNIENLSVQSNSTNLPNLLINKIFETDLNKITFFSNDENIYFVETNKISIPKNIEKYKDINLISELKNAFGNEIIKTKTISINDELINGLLSQYK